MPGGFVEAIIFIALFVAFWVLQLRTRFFSTRYFLQVGSLFAIALLSLYLLAKLLAAPITIPGVGAALLLALVVIYHAGLGLGKLRETDTRYRRMRKANRAVVAYDMPHERKTILTDDGERLQMIVLCSRAGKSDKAVIVCHGAGRSKNSIPVVQTSQILASKYDVYAFDFRGHMESSGTFRADGDTDNDLKAVLDYVRSMNYTKVAVVGWSIGAWTALLSAARGRKIDAIVAAAPPPYDLTRLSYLRLLKRLTLFHVSILPGVAVIRSLWAGVGTHTLTIEDFVRHIPNIPILLIYNDFDYASQIGAEAFEQLYERLPATSEQLRLPGTGHVFYWPNTFFVWTRMLDWLDRNF